MSSPLSPAPDATDPAQPAVAVRRLTLAALFTAIISAILVDLHILAVAGAAIWAFANTLHFGLVGLALVGALIGAPALWACWKVGVMALEAERNWQD